MVQNFKKKNEGEKRIHFKKTLMYVCGTNIWFLVFFKTWRNDSTCTSGKMSLTANSSFYVLAGR